ncbi:aldehyde dehydrogenase family protein [Chelatococcus reniformis]|uniref:Aldehyde dehydrogenase n=1 Tax=Chelatococcus reniformis TaxID=1494448 RepID=A0A916UNC8_9HYPH|nr:aldehyde dehydrogenase family protein [Chelatococcus reniformis]GGC77224.1 aldehyde dehydrogenase [Chelatococcus reniformis]
MADQWHHYIDGHSQAPSSGEYLRSFDPCAGQAAARVASGNAGDVERAVAAAATAAPAWRSRRPIERGRILLAIARAIRDKAAELADLERLETGKPQWQAPFEIEIAAQYFEFYGGLTNVFQGETINLGAGYHSYTVREPYGVVGVITPWNAPLNQAARAIAPALAAGNTVVAKPSEFTSGTTVALAQMACEACGLPPGVLNVVLGAGDVAGAALVSQPLVRKVAFTGSVRAGREIGRIAAERIIPLTLELGGKSPNIIFDDADLTQAIPGAVRAFTANAGQVCLAGSRLLVQASIHDQVVAGLTQAVGALRVGPAADATVGPLTTEAQYRRVRSYFDVARQEGARAIVGGELAPDEAWREGWFVPPTIYVGVRNDMRIAREEIFGPVLVVIPFADEAEAIRIANDTSYGLAAGIWTRDVSRVHRVAAAVEAGQIYVNEYQAGGVETPLGGYKNSGYGREKGIEALHHYTQLKCITIKL